MWIRSKYKESTMRRNKFKSVNKLEEEGRRQEVSLLGQLDCWLGGLVEALSPKSMKQFRKVKMKI
jgi:hypothetical protein